MSLAAIAGRAADLWVDRPYYRTPLDLLLAVDPTLTETPALRLIADELAGLERATHQVEDPPFLAVSLGPQEGKSTTISRALPHWLWMQNPDLRILHLSYEKEQSVQWGQQVRDDIVACSGVEGGPDHGIRLQQGSRARHRFLVAGHKGGMWCMGLAGPITGKPADVVIIDDIVKDRSVAASGAFKRLFRTKWQTAIRPRLGPGAMVVVTHTRWLEDDPIGWLMADRPGRWRYLNIPAQAGERDPLGRAPGEWLQSARGRTAGQWETTRDDVGPIAWQAMYQGEPSPAEGGLFKRANLRRWQPGPDAWHPIVNGRTEDLALRFRFITVDLAASTRTSADWTVAQVWAVAEHGELLLLDQVRVQVDPTGHWDAIRPLVEAWGGPRVYLEASQYGTDLVRDLTAEGWSVEAVEADSDKYTRALGAAKAVRQGGLYVPTAAHWLEDLIDELAEFPNGAHDDQVDALAYAHRVKADHWLPPAPSALARPRASLVDPYGAALGQRAGWDPAAATF